VVLAFGELWVQYPDMASIVGKKQGNKTYYYLVSRGVLGVSLGSSPSATWARPSR